MTKHNPMRPQRDPISRAFDLQTEIRRRFGGSEALHEDALEFLYQKLRLANVPAREAALAQLRPKARDQYAEYAARRNAEGFKASGGDRAKAPAPPVGSVGPVSLSDVPPAQRPGEAFADYLSRISTVASPGFDAHVAKPRPLKNYSPGGVLPAAALPHTVDEGMIGGSAPRIELSARARDLLASMSGPGVPWQGMSWALGPGVSVRAWVVPEEDLDGAMLRIVDRNGRARRYPWGLAQRAHAAALDLVREEEERARAERTREAGRARAVSALEDHPQSAKARMQEHWKREDNLNALAGIVRGIAAGVRVISPRQRRKLEKIAPDLADAIKRAEQADQIIAGAKHGN